MKFTIKERIVLLGVMPKEGDFRTLKQIREFREKLAFTDDENKMLDFKVVDGNINWTEKDPKDPYRIDVDVSDSILDMIIEALRTADRQKKLNADTFELYERFVVPVDEAEEAAKEAKSKAVE